MKKRFLALVLTGACLLSLTACGEKAAEPESPAAPAYTLSVETSSAEKKVYTDDGTVLLAEFTCQVPKLRALNADGTDSTDEKAKALVTKLNDHFNQTEQTYYSEFSEWADMAREDYTSRQEVEGTWSENYYDAITYAYTLTDTMLSVSYMQETYTGGAHGGTSYAGDTIDLSTGETVALSALTDDNDAFSKAVAEELQAQVTKKPAEVTEGYMEDYPQTIAQWQEQATVYFDREGMELIFEQYVLAPYAAGAQDFTIPLSMFKPYLNAYGQKLLGA